MVDIIIRKQAFVLIFSHLRMVPRIEIMNIPEMADLPEKLARTGYSHIAFSVGSIEKVDALTRPVSSLPIDFPPSATAI